MTWGSVPDLRRVAEGISYVSARIRAGRTGCAHIPLPGPDRQLNLRASGRNHRLMPHSTYGPQVCELSRAVNHTGGER